MRCLVCLNGDYGDINRYGESFSPDLVICADGGVNYVRRLGLKPDLIIGDMDSADPEIVAECRAQGTEIKAFTPEKDDTDAQLAFQQAVERGADQITILGGTGNRLDHTWSAIMSCLPLVKQGIKVKFYHPEHTLYLTTERLILTRVAGEIVSLLALTPTTGVTTYNLKYPLVNAELLPERPYAVSNVIMGDEAAVDLKSGVLMVVHITG